MSDQHVENNNHHDRDELDRNGGQKKRRKTLIGRIFNALPGHNVPGNPPVGRTNNEAPEGEAHAGEQHGHPPVGRINNEAPGSSEHSEPPVGRTNNEAPDKEK